MDETEKTFLTRNTKDCVSVRVFKAEVKEPDIRAQLKDTFSRLEALVFELQHFKWDRFTHPRLLSAERDTNQGPDS